MKRKGEREIGENSSGAGGGLLRAHWRGVGGEPINGKKEKEEFLEIWQQPKYQTIETPW